MSEPSLPEAPPLWVPLADLPAWVARKYHVAENVVATELVEAVGENELRHRVCGIKPSSAAPRWPAGVTADSLHGKIQRVFINDWEAAETDWRRGTVGGWGPPGARERLSIEVEWFSVKLFAEIRARGKWRKAVGGASAKNRQPDAEAVASIAPTQPLAAPVPRKRRTNGLDYRAADAPLVAEMHLLIEAGTARSPENAARSFIKRAAGAGNDASKAARLAKHYRESHSK